MTLVDFVVSRSIKTITRTLCRVEKDWIGQVPLQGPLIIVANHINFLDVPLMYSHLYPRPMTGFAKIETWDNPLLGMLFNLMGAIPIQRGEADRTAITRGLQALQEGKILVISPEGTRSNDGRLNPAHPGVSLMALKSMAPILPLVFFGSEQLKPNMRRLRRTDFSVRVGKPFKVDIGEQASSRPVRQQIADEVMIQLARLLPEQYHGAYSGRVGEECQYLKWVDLNC